MGGIRINADRRAESRESEPEVVEKSRKSSRQRLARKGKGKGKAVYTESESEEEEEEEEEEEDLAGCIRCIKTLEREVTQAHKANAYLLGTITDLDARVCGLEGRPPSEYEGMPQPRRCINITMSHAHNIYWERN